ncbi:hypothetical protein Y5S_01285 [Alcanivorax nanhaiticus]|uniref:Uncharacterized protein n=1 Tax=Alcanivorax nanhaiticus TaxID=1177154 RepID=A0A095SLC3_9GAMM|nr:hypothetical protein Y5S_01285 [Alcanivorax nanhaiticus]
MQRLKLFFQIVGDLRKSLLAVLDKCQLCSLPGLLIAKAGNVLADLGLLCTEIIRDQFRGQHRQGLIPCLKLFGKSLLLALILRQGLGKLSEFLLNQFMTLLQRDDGRNGLLQFTGLLQQVVLGVAQATAQECLANRFIQIGRKNDCHRIQIVMLLEAV